MKKIESQKNSFIGARYGILTITDIIHSPDHPWFLAVCRCDCGNRVTLRLSALIARSKNGAISSCGCYLAARRRKNLEGMKFGNITVRRLAMEQRPKGKKGAYWECECGLCGRVFFRGGSRIAKGASSCGCANEKGAAYHRETGRMNAKRYAKEQIVGGTNICQISVPDHVLCSSNSSGVTGVSFATRDRRWQAEISFCGKTYRRRYKIFEPAVKTRGLMREARDCALEYLKSLPETMQKEEKRAAAIAEFERLLSMKEF